jgi:hypothetical protein
MLKEQGFEFSEIEFSVLVDVELIDQTVGFYCEAVYVPNNSLKLRIVYVARAVSPAPESNECVH